MALSASRLPGRGLCVAMTSLALRFECGRWTLPRWQWAALRRLRAFVSERPWSFGTTQAGFFVLRTTGFVGVVGVVPVVVGGVLTGVVEGLTGVLGVPPLGGPAASAARWS